MVLAEPNFQSISKNQFVHICFWNWILVETKPLEFLLQLPGPSSENASSDKIESLTFGQ